MLLLQPGRLAQLGRGQAPVAAACPCAVARPRRCSRAPARLPDARRTCSRPHAPPSPRQRCSTLAGASGGGGGGGNAGGQGADDGEGGGEVYEVAESEDDVWASIALPVTMSSAEGQQVEYLVLDTDGALVEAAVEAYLQRLQEERGREDAALQEARAQADAAGGGGGGAEGEGGEAGGNWALDPTLLKRMAAVRDAERGLIVQELMYLLVVKALKDAGLTIVTDLGDAAPIGAAASAPGTRPPAEALASGRDAMGRRMEQMMPLVSLPVADGILGYVGATVSEGLRALAKDTPLSIDRVQAARLYAGMLEFGYFSRSLEAECARRGMTLGNDSEAMIQLADSLAEDELRAMCEVQSADGWYTAVRHVGGLFRLRPNPDLQLDSTALPYAELSATISDIVLEPASSIPEHYSPPGAADALKRAARSKAERGWQDAGAGVAAELPEADLVSFRVGAFAALLVEAAVIGCLLWDAERRVRGDFGYQLEAKAARRPRADSGSSAAAEPGE